MSKTDKLLAKVLSGECDASMSFDDVCYLLQKLGFTARQSKGSHVLFQRGAAFLNLQSERGKAKAYQVRQIRELLKTEA
jgi:hypothetical protein